MFVDTNSNGIVLTHMKSCSDSTQAFERLSADQSVLGLKVEKTFSGEERCPNRTKANFIRDVEGVITSKWSKHVHGQFAQKVF